MGETIDTSRYTIVSRICEFGLTSFFSYIEFVAFLQPTVAYKNIRTLVETFYEYIILCLLYKTSRNFTSTVMKCNYYKLY